MDYGGAIRWGLKIVLISFLISSGCNYSGGESQSKDKDNTSQEASTVSGVTVCGVLGDAFFSNTLFKGPDNPGPDGTVGPPDNVPGPNGGGSSTEADSSGNGTDNGETGEGSDPSDDVPGSTDGTSGGGGPDGIPGPPDGVPGPPDGVPGPPDGTTGPVNGAPGTGSDSITIQGGGRGPNGLVQYPLAIALEDSQLYSIPDIFGHFQILNCPPGDHTLLIFRYGQVIAQKYIRLTQEQDIDLKEVSGVDEDGYLIVNGFDGYQFQWEDEDGNGVNDLFTDVDGDGFCDLTGQTYAHGYGWSDKDGDGINDNFIDADGDGKNDLFPQSGYGFVFGFVDQDGDGLNDFFRDSDGDGICDLNGVIYTHSYAWQDEDEDGINDNFIDADGDGVNDRTGRRVRRGYHFEFIDQDQDGINDNFVDANGDGICDSGKPAQGMPYAHGYGWQDEDGDGINDNFTDADGDGINDVNGLAYSYGRYQYGRGQNINEKI